MAAELDTAAVGSIDGLPAGAPALARAYGAVIAAHAADAGPGSGDEAVAHLVRPLLLAAAAGVEAPPRSAPYRLVGGALSADVGAEGDAELFGALLDLCAAEGIGEAEGVAARAQSWRLPVLPFRRRAATRRLTPPAVAAPARTPGHALSREELERTRVLDLSTMWAGPLATHLLATLGAQVTRVTFPGRPDGLAAGPGAGLHEALAAGKDEVALDLREAPDRERFERLLADADVLVESFSPRVMPNLGYGEAALRGLNPGLVLGTVRAFPAWRPEARWTGYGAGVHAALGLGELPGGGFSGAAVSYPDPLAGLDLAGRILAALGRRRRDGVGRTVAASLYAAAEPLLAFPADRRLAGRPSTDELLALAPRGASAAAATA